MIETNYMRTKEILSTIIDYLATEEGDMRARLKIMTPEIFQLDESYFPNDLKGEWKFIETTLTKKPEKLNYKKEQVLGSVENTLNHMKNKTACNVAKSLYILYEEFYFGKYASV